jgi:hypothetical protein
MQLLSPAAERPQGELCGEGSGCAWLAQCPAACGGQQMPAATRQPALDLWALGYILNGVLLLQVSTLTLLTTAPEDGVFCQVFCSCLGAHVIQGSVRSGGPAAEPY